MGWMDRELIIFHSAAKRSVTHSKSSFVVKNIGHTKSGPKAAHGNFAMRKKNSGSLKKKWDRREEMRHILRTHTQTHSAKLVVKITTFVVAYATFSFTLRLFWLPYWNRRNCLETKPKVRYLRLRGRLAERVLFSWQRRYSQTDHALGP